MSRACCSKHQTSLVWMNYNNDGEISGTFFFYLMYVLGVGFIKKR